jgi:hypothetical protein
VSKRQRGTRRPSTASLHHPIDDSPTTGDSAAGAGSNAQPTSGPGSTGTSGRDATRVTSAQTKLGGSNVTSRSARRRARTATVARKKSPLERYRGLLLAGFAILGVGIIAVVFFQSATAAPYVCQSLLTPGPVETLPTQGPTPLSTPSPVPTPSPSPTPAPTPDPSASPGPSASPAVSPSPSPSPSPVPSPTIHLGFGTKDLGKTHELNNNASVTYEFCPPTSGRHYNDPGKAPLPRAFYGPEVTLKPQNWVHNLEHGYVVILYKDHPPADVIDSIKQVIDSAKGSDFAIQTCKLANKVIAVRFDDMATPFALVAWDRALLLDQWDPVTAKTFAEQWQDHAGIPESSC